MMIMMQLNHLAFTGVSMPKKFTFNITCKYDVVHVVIGKSKY